jgi:hypothetical protein
MKLVLAAALIVALPGFGSAQEAASDGGKVVVELYTSQGCSSCPPADKYLSELAQRDDIVALSFHVDYWNYIGWRDPYSDAQWSKRQRAYGQNLKKRFVYTPQMVIDGRVEAVGSRRSQVRRMIARAGTQKKLKIEVSHPDSDSLLIRVPGNAEYRGGPATVWLAFYDSQRKTPVSAGENSGQTIINSNVVRSMNPVGTWRGEELKLSLALSDFEAEGRDGCAILVQERNVGRILGATTIPLTKTAAR